MKLFLKILAMATCQHDIRLEGLFREGHVKLLRQKLLATEAGQAYTPVLCVWVEASLHIHFQETKHPYYSPVHDENEGSSRT